MYLDSCQRWAPWILQKTKQMALFSRSKLLFLEQNSLILILRNISARKKRSHRPAFLFEEVSDDANITGDAKKKKKKPQQKQCCFSKWTISCELSALTARGLATLDFFFFPGGVHWVWSWSSCSGTHSLCSRTGGWLWEAPTRPRMSHLLWSGDQARCINDWYEERGNFGGRNEKEAGCIHLIEVPPGWKLRGAIVMIPASSWVSFRLNRLFSDTHDCRWSSNRLNWLSSLL